MNLAKRTFVHRCARSPSGHTNRILLFVLHRVCIEFSSFPNGLPTGSEESARNRLTSGDSTGTRLQIQPASVCVQITNHEVP